MKVTVWIASSVLALAFVTVGAGKLFASSADLHTTAQGVPIALFRIAGTAEVLGAIGLLAPAATRILPILTPVAASCLTLTMVGATVTNLAVGEPATAVVTIVLGGVAAMVAWARSGPVAVQPRAVGSGLLAPATSDLHRATFGQR